MEMSTQIYKIAQFSIYGYVEIHMIFEQFCWKNFPPEMHFGIFIHPPDFTKLFLFSSLSDVKVCLCLCKHYNKRIKVLISLLKSDYGGEMRRQEKII